MTIVILERPAPFQVGGNPQALGKHPRSTSPKGGAVNDKKSESPEQIPFLQKLYDSPFVLLLLGIAVMFILYTGWGIVEILTLPPSTLP